MDAFVGSLIVAVLTIAVQFTLARRNVLLEFSKERQAAYTSYLEACLIGIRHVKLVREITEPSATVTSQNPQYYDLLRTKIIEQSFAYESQIAMSLARVHVVAPVKYRKETYAINSAITQYNTKPYTPEELDIIYSELAVLFHNDIQGIFERASKLKSFFSIKYLLNG